MTVSDSPPNAFPAKSWRKPGVLLALILCFSGAAGAIYSLIPPNPDESLYDYIGWTITGGGTPYVDSADQNFPGAMYYHAAATAIFGNHIWSFRLFDFLWLLIACGLLFHFTRRYFGSRAAWIVVPVYQAIYIAENFWVSGQRDLVAAPLLLLVVSGWLLRIETNRRVWCAVQGVAIAIAFLIRPTLLVLLPILAAIDLLLMRRTRRSWQNVVIDGLLVGLALASVILVVALAGWRSGAVREWYHVAIRYNLEVYGKDGKSLFALLRDTGIYALRTWYWHMALAAIGLVAFWRTRAQVIAPLLGILLSTGISIVAQKKGFGYHFGPMLIVLAIGIAAILSLAIEKFCHDRLRTIGGAVALLTIILATVGLGKRIASNCGREVRWYAGRISTQTLLSSYEAGDGMTENDAAELARYVEQTVAPDQTVLLWGRQLTVNYLAKRRLPFRFSNFALLDMPRPAFSQFARWDGEIALAMSEHPPELILLPTVGEGAANLARRETQKCLGDAIFTTLHARYTLEGTSPGMVQIYRLKH